MDWTAEQIADWIVGDDSDEEFTFSVWDLKETIKHAVYLARGGELS